MNILGGCQYKIYKYDTFPCLQRPSHMNPPRDRRVNRTSSVWWSSRCVSGLSSEGWERKGNPSWTSATASRSAPWNSLSSSFGKPLIYKLGLPKKCILSYFLKKCTVFVFKDLNIDVMQIDIIKESSHFEMFNLWIYFKSK